MADTIDIGIDGILRGSEGVIDNAEALRDSQLNRLEREFKFNQAVVKLGFAWNVLAQDVASASSRYISNLGNKTIRLMNSGLVLRTEVENRALQSLVIATASHWGGADVQVRATGADIEQMDTYYYEFDDHAGVSDFIVPAKQIEEDIIRHKMDANYFVTGAGVLHDYLYVPSHKRPFVN